MEYAIMKVLIHQTTTSVDLLFAASLEIIFMWAYLFLIFGVYDHMKIFRKNIPKNQI